GDIKPANIIINRHGDAKLADLGLAKSAYEESAAEVMATPMYAAPELIRGDAVRVDVKTDIYSFGITLYHMLAGDPPFNEEDPEKVMDMHLNDKHEPLAEIFKISNFPKEFSDFVDRLIAKDSAERPESWSEIVAFLKSSSKLKYGNAKQAQGNPGFPQNFLSNKLAVAGAVLTVAALIAAAAAGVWWFSHERAPGDAPKLKAKVVNPAAERKKKMQETWDAVRNGLKYMRCNDAVESIKRFIATYSPDDTMLQEAEVLMKEYQQQAEAQAAKKAALDVAKAAAAEEIKALEATLEPEKVKKYDAQEMVEAACGLRDFLNKCGKGAFPEGCVSAESEKRYAGLQEKFTTSAENLRAAAQKKRIAQVAAALKNYADSSKRSAVENERRFNALKDYDEYSAALNEFLELPRGKQNSVFFKKVADPDVRRIAAAMKPRLQFLADNLPFGNNPLPVFLNKSERFAGKEIPWDVDKPGEKYTLNSIDSATMTMHLISKLTEGAFSRKKIALNKLSNQQIAVLADNWVGKSAVSVSAEEFGRLANWLNSIKEYAVLDRLLNRSDLAGVNVALWTRCMTDFRNAAIESQAAEHAARITEMMRRNNRQVALNEISAFLAKFQDTETADRYRSYFEEYVENTIRFNPEFQLSFVIEKFKKALKAGDYVAAMNISCVMVNRFAFLKCLTPPQRRPLTEYRAKCLEHFNKIAGTLPETPPFSQPAGELWRWQQHNKKRYSGPVNNLLELDANMDIAEWSLVRQLLSGKKIDMAGVIESSETDGTVIAPMLYSLNIAASRFDDEELKGKVMDAYERLIRNASNNKSNPDAQAVCAGWAMRSALLVRNPQRALFFCSDLTFRNIPGKDDLRNALLHLQAVLQREDVTSGSFAALAARYSSAFNKAGMDNDCFWINTVSRIISNSGNFSAELNALSVRKCIFPELTASLLCDAAARSLYLDRSIDVKAVLQAVEPVIADSVIYGELWYKAALLRTIASGTVLDGEKTASAVLNDYRICAVPYYSRILSLMTLSAMLNGSINPRDAGASLRRFMEFCPLSGTVDRRIQACLTAQDSGKYFTQFAGQGGFNENSFWLGCVAAVAEFSNKRSEEIPAVVDAMSKYSAQMLWQERLLFRCITDQIAVKQAGQVQPK
ncbi:MAG: serine/threonine-protein kinase, partial [Victivallaceae bacterium]